LKPNLFQDTSEPHLVALPSSFVPSSVGWQRCNTISNNTNSKNLKIQSQKKYITFNMKQQKKVFLELDYKERKNM
jgi:hypothetical protein